MSRSPRTRLRLAFWLTAFALLAIVAVLHNARQARVFVLHSLVSSEPRTQAFIQGVQDHFAAPRRVSLRFLPVGAGQGDEHEHAACMNARRQLQRFEPNVVIALDARAVQCARSLVGAAHWQLLGIDPHPPDGPSGSPRVHTLVHGLPLDAWREVFTDFAAARRLAGVRPLRVQLLGDASPASVADARTFTSLARPGAWDVTAMATDDWTAWQDRVATARQDLDLLVIGRHARVADAHGQWLAGKDVVQRVRRAAGVPLAALELAGVHDGAGFSIALDGRSQGRVAAGYAEQLLRGEPSPSANTPTIVVALRRSFVGGLPATFSPIYEAVARSVGVYLDDG